MAEPTNLPPAARQGGDVSFKRLLIGGGAMAFFVALMLGLAKILYPAAISAVPLADPRFPQPRLQASPDTDFARFHRAQTRALDTPAWLDASHQAVRVPIGDAMRKLAQDGIPDWPNTPRREQ